MYNSVVPESAANDNDGKKNGVTANMKFMVNSFLGLFSSKRDDNDAKEQGGGATTKTNEISVEQSTVLRVVESSSVLRGCNESGGSVSSRDANTYVRNRSRKELDFFEEGVGVHCVTPDGKTKEVILRISGECIAWGQAGSQKYLAVPLAKVEVIKAGLPSKLHGNGWNFPSELLFHMTIGTKSAPFLCTSEIERDMCIEILIDFKRSLLHRTV